MVLVHFDAADQACGKGRQLLQQRLLIADDAVFVDLKHLLVKIATPDVGLPWRNRVHELVRHPSEVRLHIDGPSDLAGERQDGHTGKQSDQ